MYHHVYMICSLEVIFVLDLKVEVEKCKQVLRSVFDKRRRNSGVEALSMMRFF